MQQNSSDVSQIHHEVQVRHLLESDLSWVEELVQQAGWNQLLCDWQRILRYEPNGCFAAFSGLRLVGTVTTTTYGKDLGWIGMMLVHPDFRRLGIATGLMQHSISYLNGKETKCIKLDATPAGLCVYERLGFVSEWKFNRWELIADRPNDAKNKLNTILRDNELDRIAFGADRSHLLDRIEESSISVGTEGGFGMLRSGRIASYLGPVVALTAASAEQIVRSLISQKPGRIFWDIPGPNLAAQTIAKQLGFQPVRELTRMKLGVSDCTPNMMLQYAIAGPETG
jgi:GNAT superfamily N-acetyltransferase